MFARMSGGRHLIGGRFRALCLDTGVAARLAGEAGMHRVYEVRERRCVVCGYPFSDMHHLFSRTEAGKRFDNQIALCPNHHRFATIIQGLLNAGMSEEKADEWAREHCDAQYLSRIHYIVMKAARVRSEAQRLDFDIAAFRVDLCALAWCSAGAPEGASKFFEDCDRQRATPGTPEYERVEKWKRRERRFNKLMERLRMASADLWNEEAYREASRQLAAFMDVDFREADALARRATARMDPGGKGDAQAPGAGQSGGRGE